MLIRPAKSFRRIISLPGDKSIFHRSAILAALARGTSKIYNYPKGNDALSTLSCLQELGVSNFPEPECCIVHGSGIDKLIPSKNLDARNSGTTLRLISGILPHLSGTSIITGDASLQKRPMKRVIEPLALMGAKIKYTGNFNAPLTFHPSRMQNREITPQTASAQIKSMLMLSALFSEGTALIKEIRPTRNHLENLFSLAKIDFSASETLISVPGKQTPQPFSLTLPGDFSSGAFFIAPALMLSGGVVTLKNVGINPGRTGFLSVLQRMGAEIIYKNRSFIFSGEEICDLTISHNKLNATIITEDEVVTLIDELPLFALIATIADGVSRVKGAKELRVKESDRIKAVVSELSKMGAVIRELPDGFEIEGPVRLKGAQVDSQGDHRIAMMLAAAALSAKGETFINKSKAADISYPEFYKILTNT